MTTLLIVLAIFILVFFGTAMSAGNEQAKKIAAMSPEERNNYMWGDINIHLICPHCQTVGTVHAKMVTKSVTSTGKVGGIVKSNTETTTKTVVTQHHCVKCNSTWDI